MSERATPSATWRAVDASGDAGEMISYLDRAASATVALRAESLKLLRLSPGDMVLDAGCGSGVAAVELAALVGGEGRVHAIDPSDAMVSRTSERAGMLPIEASIGDVRSLDVPTGSCDAARTERVLIHLTPEECKVAVSELARVVRPGGRIALVETCHVQCRIDGDDFLVPSATAGVANPAAGLQLRAALLGAGCHDVQSLPRPLSFASIAELAPVARLEVLARVAVRSGAPEAEVASALAEMHRRDEEGTFFAVMMFYVAAGTVDG